MVGAHFTRDHPLESCLLVVVVGVSICLQAVVTCRTRTAHRNPSGLQSFRRRYLLAYCLCTFGDWIQGAYVYALYSAWGFTQRQIGHIFVVGYASSATFGTLLASAGDRHGHKLNVLLYCLIYAASCLIAHSSSLLVLLVGRALAGVAYSLLFTAFESWAVAEVDAKGLGRACLSNVFGSAVATSAIAAVLSGVVGQACVGYDYEAVVSAPGSVLETDSWWGADTGEGSHEGHLASEAGTLPEAITRRLLGGADMEARKAASRERAVGVAAAAAAQAVAVAGAGSGAGAWSARSPLAMASSAEPLALAAAELAAAERGAGLSNPYVAVFDVSAVILLFAAVSVQILWDERTGAQYLEDPTSAHEVASHGERRGAGAAYPHANKALGFVGVLKQLLRELESGVRIVWADETMLLIGTLNALYEGSLFLFVFVWTPVLEHRKAAESGVPPHGLAFSLFMVCKLAGSLVFVLLQQRGAHPSHSLLNGILLLSTAALAMPIFFPSYSAALVAFCLFEAAFGAYWPAMATLRAEVLPDSMRATVAAVFRVPLNVLVIGGLLLASAIDDEGVLWVCALLMLACFCLSYRLKRRKGSSADAGGMGDGDVRGRVVLLSEKSPAELPPFLRGGDGASVGASADGSPRLRDMIPGLNIVTGGDAAGGPPAVWSPEAGGLSRSRSHSPAGASATAAAAGAVGGGTGGGTGAASSNGGAGAAARDGVLLPVGKPGSGGAASIFAAEARERPGAGGKR